MDIKQYVTDHKTGIVIILVLSMMVTLYGLGIHGSIPRALGNGTGMLILCIIIGKLTGKL